MGRANLHDPYPFRGSGKQRTSRQERRSGETARLDELPPVHVS
jgi:hypothetical protein